MNKLRIIVPSRERPENAIRLIQQMAGTIPKEADISVVFAVDHDDPTIEFYPPNHLQVVEGGTMVKALNEVALTSMNDYEYLGFLGDDTLPQGNWYNEIIYALEGAKNSIVYGNDGYYGEQLPTGAFLDAQIVRRLGWMAPPAQKHLYVDNFWKSLGEALGTLVYVESALIEHIHPFSGKALQDDVYAAAYTAERWNHDQIAYETYIDTNFIHDVERIIK